MQCIAFWSLNVSRWLLSCAASNIKLGAKYVMESPDFVVVDLFGQNITLNAINRVFTKFKHMQLSLLFVFAFVHSADTNRTPDTPLNGSTDQNESNEKGEHCFFLFIFDE